MVEVALPRLVGSRAAARTLLEPLKGDLDGGMVILDCRRLRSAPPSFADELVRILFEERSLGALTLRDASDEFVGYVESAMSRRNVPAERLTKF